MTKRRKSDPIKDHVHCPICMKPYDVGYSIDPWRSKHSAIYCSSCKSMIFTEEQIEYCVHQEYAEGNICGIQPREWDKNFLKWQKFVLKVICAHWQVDDKKGWVIFKMRFNSYESKAPYLTPIAKVNGKGKFVYFNTKKRTYDDILALE